MARPDGKSVTDWRLPVPPDVTESIFWQAAGPLIGGGEPSAVLLAGMIVLAADAMLVNLADTPANRAFFGSTGTADDSSPFPQLRRSRHQKTDSRNDTEHKGSNIPEQSKRLKYAVLGAKSPNRPASPVRRLVIEATFPVTRAWSGRRGVWGFARKRRAPQGGACQLCEHPAGPPPTLVRMSGYPARITLGG
jgi:hypothetical protein